MKIINQTNRTVLFDVINPECLDLINLMAGIETTDKSLTDEKIKEIHSHLLVRSFDEFLRKFAPTIYSYLMPTASVWCIHWSGPWGFRPSL